MPEQDATTEQLVARLVEVVAEVIPVDLDDNTTIIRQDEADGMNVWGPPEVVARAAVAAMASELVALNEQHEFNLADLAHQLTGEQ